MGKLVAYFCAEFGIDPNMPTYAGGLGILAGDTLFEAAEQNFPMVGVGLLYQGRAFMQRFDKNGWQIEQKSDFQPDLTNTIRPVAKNGEPVIITIDAAGDIVFVKAYQMRLGDNTVLYLLSTDLVENTEAWRTVLAQEYCCSDEDQFRQQLILGIGGYRLIREIGIRPTIYHFQEGRPIFAHWEIAREIVEGKKMDYGNALEEAKKKIVYTNHTLVAAGNLVYNVNIVKKYANHYAEKHDFSARELVKPGLTADAQGFSMTQYAVHTSRIASSVSQPHFELCQKVWGDKNWVNATNGVHMKRWQSPAFLRPSESDKDFWKAHMDEKMKLLFEVKRRSGYTYDPNRLIVGWARRISGYKQLASIFTDINRLKLIVTNTDRPIHLLIAGKAHPGDDWGKKLIQDIMNYMSDELNGHALFVPNYDIALARKLVSGVDVWLNTPEYGKEASGTSGMKAAANGILNCTVSDGWAREVDWNGAGWVLDHNNLANSVYEHLADKIAPLYYGRNDEQLPTDWIGMMRKSIQISKKYSTTRMLSEYDDKLYSS